MIIIAKVKDAFGASKLNGSKIAEHRFLVEDDRVYIWDEVSETFTTCHSLSDKVQARIRKMAANQ